MRCPVCEQTRWQCVSCGYCGAIDIPLLIGEQRTLDALGRVLRRGGGALPTTQAIADEVPYCVTWAWQCLVGLETKGLVERPHGVRSGWAIVNGHK